ncbi:uncharacterized protein LOC135372477 [Ornithodoros turicata]|uniref:uncharacterized protein LOC135372477 n=1 Tax=Ornithodoros turicata TaxID=34597 RepID=UPI00313A1B02
MERRRSLMLLREILLLKQRQCTYRSTWVRPVWANRRTESEYFTAMQTMRKSDPEVFFKLYRMTPELFDQLHEMVRLHLTKQQCVREPISSCERLAMTLRYLSCGDPIQDIALSYRVGIETAREAIHLTCRVIWDTLSPLYMKPPTEEECRQIANGFWEQWQFPGCVGAVDGKHIQIECPKKSGSLFFNYKKTFSVVLLAVADSKYRFVLIDVGASGRTSDGGVLKESAIGKRLERNTLGLPSQTCLPGTTTYTQHVFVGDEAFQLRTDFMRPFPGRRCVENAFGILVARWRVFRTPLKLDPDDVDYVVKAACVLHNYLCSHIGTDSTYCPPGLVDTEDNTGNLCEGRWREIMAQNCSVFKLEYSPARNSSRAAVALRDTLAAYFMTEEGAVPWQWRIPGVRGQQH